MINNRKVRFNPTLNTSSLNLLTNHQLHEYFKRQQRELSNLDHFLKSRKARHFKTNQSGQSRQLFNILRTRVSAPSNKTRNIPHSRNENRMNQNNFGIHLNRSFPRPRLSRGPRPNPRKTPLLSQKNPMPIPRRHGRGTNTPSSRKTPMPRVRQTSKQMFKHPNVSL